MSQKRDTDNKAIHGLCIVDTTVAETSQSEDDKALSLDEDSLVVKIQDETDNTIDNDDACEVTEEVDEKINLFDVLIEKVPAKETKENFHNSTLIITTEEHLDTIVGEDAFSTSTETVKNVKKDSADEDSKKVMPKTKLKTNEQSQFWVSNVSRHVKAADLKKFFSQMGKVVTAKVLTNGKSYFGYVSVDSVETTNRCIKQLNNSLFEGKKITVTKDRPDLKEPKQPTKLEPKKKKEKVEPKKENKTVEPKVPEEKQVKKNKHSDDEAEKSSDIVEDLKKKVERFKAEATKYKWKILEYQRRHEGMRKKCGVLEKDLKETQFKMRADRRRLNQEWEQFEKTKKLEMTRLEAEKTALNKELAETKKLREHLKTRMDDLKEQQAKKNTKRRTSRSPPSPMERAPRGRSPMGRVGSRVGYNRPDDKKRKREDPPRGRTPPPPPKLSNGMGKKRGDNRQYFDGPEKRSSTMDHGYDFRHKPAFGPPQEMSRAPWQPPYGKDPRRMNTAPSGSGPSYPSDPRYGGSYQFQPSNIAVPQRSYYPEFGKPYGHY